MFTKLIQRGESGYNVVTKLLQRGESDYTLVTKGEIGDKVVITGKSCENSKQMVTTW